MRLEGTLIGSVMLGFRDGTTLRLDPYASGAAELIDKISGTLEADDGTGTN